jgi:hypothetical protein
MLVVLSKGDPQAAARVLDSLASIRSALRLLGGAAGEPSEPEPDCEQQQSAADQQPEIEAREWKRASSAPSADLGFGAAGGAAVARYRRLLSHRDGREESESDDH